MIDFLMISTRSTKRGTIEIYPKFRIKKSSDLMIRGSDFYAIWLEERGFWSTDEDDAVQLIDHELDMFALEYKKKTNSDIRVLYMWDAETGMIDVWHKYCQRQLRDNFKALDENLIFSNHKTEKKDYATKTLSYPLEEGPIPSYEKLISTLYLESERHKIEWVIGAIVSGDSKKLQKFMVLYGEAGSGKSTILNIVQQLFEGYYSVFDAKALGSSSNMFALEAFKTNPLVAIQHDGDLSRIEDNTRINSLVSHELMSVNEKFKPTYPNRFKSFLFMGTNRPVKITDAKSGLIRRLIDVTPSGNRLNSEEYERTMNQITFELGGIAKHCLSVYLANPSYYNSYIPSAMLGASNDFYNFVIDAYHVFKKEDGTTLKAAWEMYKNYCEDAKVPYPLSQRGFKEELKNYFVDYKERFNADDGTRVRSYYHGFRYEKFEERSSEEEQKESKYTIKLDSIESVFDRECGDFIAQYSSVGTNEVPLSEWSKVKTKLKDIDTSKLHYVRVPENHIVIDFDITDEKGEKSYERNVEAASLFPPTYTETSKSGKGIHLHYIYSGDPKMLSRVYKDHIEVKVFTGNSSLRRRLSKCNTLPIASISSGLPLKGDKKMVNFEGIKSERGIRTMIKKNLNKESHPGTKPSIDFIYKILDDAYEGGMKYDVTDMRSSVLAFAANSTNNADYCIKIVNKMKFKSEEPSANTENEDRPLIFFDVECFPNLFLVNWKIKGKGKPIVRMINPSPKDIEELMRFRLIGFNCRKYDNHMIYARLMGYTTEQLYNLSVRILNKSKNCFFNEAYKVSYTDIYDFASAGNKMSLKKWEIKLGIHHKELGFKWDEPVPEEKWPEVAEYCDYDVLASEAVFDYLSGDWTARKILADVAGMSYNDSTNQITTRIIFGNARKPQSEFNWRDLSKPVSNLPKDCLDFLKKSKPDMMANKHYGWENEGKDEVPFDSESILPYFPGYTFSYGKSIYRGEEVGEGGYVYAESGTHLDVALLDIISMHPNSTIAEVLFGVKFTTRFKEIVDGRVGIKHEAWADINDMLDGVLKPYIDMVIRGEMTSSELANALKTAINSVYGLTSAKFDNPFKDSRNIDNIVAKRGALFMIDLKHFVQERGFTVAHIKTDSIKIPNATPDIIKDVMDMGLRYGYEFEHEATYDKMCLVNDAVYIAMYASIDRCRSLYGYVPGDNKKKENRWTATGTQFAVPYVFKTLFSKEDIVFSDLCEVKSVTSQLYLDMNENLPDVSQYEKELVAIKKADVSRDFKEITNISFGDRATELEAIIATGHDYIFVGKVGRFCPILSGCGGGQLVREKDGKYYAATGTKGYRWLESEMVDELNKQKDIDRSYYDNLVNDAIDTINKFGDFEWFVG